MNEFDVIIIGSGAAGLFCALHLDHRLKILIITKTDLRGCNSYLAQGGITAVLGKNDKSPFINDTLQAGRNENDVHAVKLLADRSENVISELLNLQMPFTMQNGRLCYTKEGGHSKSRIVYAKDETGKHLIETLLNKIVERKNITLWKSTSLIDILENTVTKTCTGVVLEKNGEIINMLCHKTVLACGGIGGLFKNSTNQETVSGDALAIAYKHGIVMKNLSCIQFHPTALYEPSANARRFLISESVRGEGAYLLNPDKERFVNELLPRNVVTAAILDEQKKYNNTPYVYLDISHRDGDYITERFPCIYKKCLLAGYDFTKESIPVTPSQHYHMGGIQVDLQGKTSMNNLYAVGEVSCSGAHGANRLASNSLLEALVYGAEAAFDINRSIPLSSVQNKDYIRLPSQLNNSGTKTPLNELSFIAPTRLGKKSIVYPELKDSKYRAKLVQSLLINENGGIYNELRDC